jgi:hypothetical protein
LIAVSERGLADAAAAVRNAGEDDESALISSDNKDALLRLCGAFRSQLADLALELAYSRGQLVIMCFDEESVEAAAMVHGSKRARGDAQPDRSAKRIGDQGDVQQIGEEAPFGLDV